MTNTHSKKKNINLAEEAAATKAEGKCQNFKDWLDMKGIANFPIRVTHKPTQKRLQSFHLSLFRAIFRPMSLCLGLALRNILELFYFLAQAP